MTDPLRSDRLSLAAEVPEREREARVEELLLAGLDHYFSEQHELAINVWTRVLFIDRGHARARAYIERARSAIAERQRKGDELLHIGSAAFDRGDAGAARDLVRSAVEHGASLDEALALLARIDRLENAAQPVPLAERRSPPQPEGGRVAGETERRARLRWIGAGLLAGIVLCALALLVALGPRAVPGALFGRVEGVGVSTLNAPLPVPSLGGVALSRGEALYGKGHLHDALAALEDVPDGDPLRGRADALVAVIQRQLLAAARSGDLGRSETPARRP
jgi:hypothetical protein